MIRLKRTHHDDPDFKTLVEALDEELWERYPAIQQNFAPHNKVDASVRIIVAYLDDAPVGCGAFRAMEKTVMEIKRMYVDPNVRGRGIAKEILRALETWGRDEGFLESKLETGLNQPEAIAVYKRANYVQIPNYPPYDTITESMCMAKMLA